MSNWTKMVTEYTPNAIVLSSAEIPAIYFQDEDYNIVGYIMDGDLYPPTEAMESHIFDWGEEEMEDLEIINLKTAIPDVEDLARIVDQFEANIFGYGHSYYPAGELFLGTSLGLDYAVGVSEDPEDYDLGVINL